MDYYGKGGDDVSVVISYVSDLISFVVTDTRISYGLSMDDIKYYKDNKDKLYNISNMGWCAGVGANGFINYIKEEISSVNITSTSEVQMIYKNALEKSFRFKEYNSDAVSMTGLVVSTVTFNSELCTPVTRVIILSSDNTNDDNNVYYLNKNIIYIMYPINYINNTKLIDDLITKINLNHEFNGDVEEILYKILTIFSIISSNSNGVSKICDIGLQYYSQTENKFVKGRIKDNIDILIESYYNKNIFAYMQIVE